MRVFYGVSGEGLKHASRTLSVVDQLPECEIHIFTYGAAHCYLRSIGYPHLHIIRGLTFSYRRQRVDYVRSLSKAGLFCLSGLRRNIEQIKCAADRPQPSLCVSDFEPSIARVAHIWEECRPISAEFVHDLAHCDRLVSTAGHQLICEARYFHKPMLAVPEPGQYEQYINAWYVQRNGLGMQCRAERLTCDAVRAFVEFLKNVKRHSTLEKLYIVGDFIDGWKLRRSWYWTDECSLILRKILSLMAVKHNVKQACNYVGDFETYLALYARERGCDGCVCGHIHTAALRRAEDGFLYANAGDWVESCTAIIEDESGHLSLWNYGDALHVDQCRDEAAHSTEPAALVVGS